MIVNFIDEKMTVPKLAPRNNYSQSLIEPLMPLGLKKILKQPYQQGFWVPKSKFSLLKDCVLCGKIFDIDGETLRVYKVENYLDGLVVFFSNEKETKFKGFVFFEIYPHDEVAIQDNQDGLKIKSRFENKAAYVSREYLLLVVGDKKSRWDIKSYADFKYLFGDFLKLTDEQYLKIQRFFE